MHGLCLYDLKVDIAQLNIASQLKLNQSKILANWMFSQASYKNCRKSIPFS